jgi:predicted dinucleotide-binding enzyme
MRIGIIGIGNITLNLAYKAAHSGHAVMINNPQGNNIVKDSIQKLGNNVKLVDIQQAALAEILILFIPRENLESFADILPNMEGKIILHTNNAFFCLEDLPAVSIRESSSETLACLLPSAHIIRLYNTLKPSISLLQNRDRDPIKIFYEGKNNKAKKNAKAFLETLNFSVVDLNDMKKHN